MVIDSIRKSLGEIINDWSYSKLIEWGISENSAKYLNVILLCILFTVLLFALQFLVRKLLLGIIENAAKRSKTQFDDHLINNSVLWNLTRLIPLYLAVPLIPVVFEHFPGWIS